MATKHGTSPRTSFQAPASNSRSKAKRWFGAARGSFLSNIPGVGGGTKNSVRLDNETRARSSVRPAPGSGPVEKPQSQMPSGPRYNP